MCNVNIKAICLIILSRRLINSRMNACVRMKGNDSLLGVLYRKKLLFGKSLIVVNLCLLRKENIEIDFDGFSGNEVQSCHF